MRAIKFIGLVRTPFVHCSLVCFFALSAVAQTSKPAAVQVDWKQTISALKTSSTLQVVVNPMLRRGSPIHNAAFQSLHDVGADYVRYVPWLPYPKLAVAELQPPGQGKTSWDFSLIDPMTEDFFSATAGHSVIVNFSTIPAWMFKTGKPVSYPEDPDQVDWNYTQGTELRDPSIRQLGDYYARLVGWYTRGGFTDELGKRRESGHHYKIEYWEVFNEVDAEHSTTPQQYTQRYDTVVAAIHKVDPEIKFVGLALANPGANPKMFSYFLNHANHRAGIPLDMISYHFYATPTKTQTLNDWQYTFFDQADHFLTTVRYVEALRTRLSPETRTTLDEIGSILPTDNAPDDAKELIPPAYWNLSGALYAYVFMETAKLGIDVAGESQLVGYPSQFPSVTMMDWSTGNPNARLRVLELLHQSFSPGDHLVSTRIGGTAVAAQALLTTTGKKLLLVNKRNRDASVNLPELFDSGKIITVDTTTGASAPAIGVVHGNLLLLHPFAVCVVTSKK
jgi:hypothetical protein